MRIPDVPKVFAQMDKDLRFLTPELIILEVYYTIIGQYLLFLISDYLVILNLENQMLNFFKNMIQAISCMLSIITVSYPLIYHGSISSTSLLV